MKMVWAYSDKEATLEDVLSCVGPGWAKLLTDLIHDLFKLGWDGRLADIKEKFGSLRFYPETNDGEIWDRILVAEDESAKTCEVCGAQGRVRTDGWWKCLCRDHWRGEVSNE